MCPQGPWSFGSLLKMMCFVDHNLEQREHRLHAGGACSHGLGWPPVFPFIFHPVGAQGSDLTLLGAPERTRKREHNGG